MPAPVSVPICDVYIDESSQNDHPYLVMGGIAVELSEIVEFTAKIQTARLPELPYGQMKWAKVSKSKLVAYKRVVDVFFDCGDMAHYHSLHVETAKQNHAKFNQGSEEIGFN